MPDRKKAERVAEQGAQRFRSRRVAAELRRLRERAGFTGDQVAEHFGWSASKISRAERGQTAIKSTDLRLLLDYYGVSETRRSELLALAQESTKTTWIEAPSISPEVAEFIEAEAEARTLWNWEPQIVPGLLQTQAYAQEIMLGWDSIFRVPPADIDLTIETRLMRQQVLSRDPALELSAVVDESVIMRRLGSNSTMRQQLTRLAELCDMPNIEIRILPLQGEHPLGTGSFAYLQFPKVHEVPRNDLVVVEQLASNYYLEDQTETNLYRVAFERLRADALTPSASRELLVRTAHDVWGAAEKTGGS